MATQGAIEIKNIPLNKIKLSKNSRLNISDDEIAGLMASIKQSGLLQPIGLVKNGTGYEICYGNRRFLAVSKLGSSSIPAVIHENKKANDNDIRNLTENIQRRNISLVEAGRYMELLKNEGLSSAEIAVRIGVSKSYIESCLDAYQRVPKEFREDLEIKVVNDKQRTPGKISIRSARAILNARTAFDLSAAEVKKLFQEAKSDKFSSENVPKYAAAIKNGQDLSDVAMKKMVVQFWMDQSEYERLQKKHIVNGSFRSMNSFFVSLLKGEKSEKVKIK